MYSMFANSKYFLELFKQPIAGVEGVEEARASIMRLIADRRAADVVRDTEGLLMIHLADVKVTFTELLMKEPLLAHELLLASVKMAVCDNELSSVFSKVKELDRQSDDNSCILSEVLAFLEDLSIITYLEDIVEDNTRKTIINQINRLTGDERIEVNRMLLKCGIIDRGTLYDAFYSNHRSPFVRIVISINKGIAELTRLETLEGYGIGKEFLEAARLDGGELVDLMIKESVDRIGMTRYLVTLGIMANRHNLDSETDVGVKMRVLNDRVQKMIEGGFV